MRGFSICAAGSALVLSLFFQACVQETSTDDFQRQRERDRAAVQSIERDYDVIVGKYSGEAPTSDGDYGIVLELSLVRVSRDGTSVSQPTLIGTLELTNLDMKAKGEEGATQSLSLVDGNYDSASGQLAISSPGMQSSAGIDVNCSRASYSKLDCRYRPRGPGLWFDFSVTKN